MRRKPFCLRCLAFSLLSTAVLVITAEARVKQSLRECNAADAIAAQEESDALPNWEQLHRSFKRFGHCDDGAIGEGWSDTVVRLLTKEWSTLLALVQIVAKDREFERFVLKHVDELMSPDQARQIVANARTKCPRNARRLCRELELRAAEPGK
jgi:hypothetical protein